MASTWWDVLSQKGIPWGVIEQPEVVTFAQQILAANTANNAARESPGDRVLIARANEALKPVVAFMRVLNRRFLARGLKDSDRISLGLRPRDIIRTPHIEVTEVVEFELRLRNIREVLVNFWIKGATHRAKPTGYDGAVIIWAILPAPPTTIDSLTSHTMASRTPHALTFTEDERGQTVYIALSWQNERGNIGEWSDIQSAVIP
jgi:hypothetical protein